MKDNIENCNTVSDMYETLNPNNQKDFDKDNINGYSWNVASRGFMDKDGKLNVTSWNICHSFQSVVNTKPSPLLNMNIKQTVKHIETLAEKAFSDICKKSQERTEAIRDKEIASKISSVFERLNTDSLKSFQKLLNLKTIDIAVCGCNSAGAVITSVHILTLSIPREAFLLFSKLVSKSRFFKEAIYTKKGRLLYKFNIKVYDKHELNIDKTLSNYSDSFVKWYVSFCLGKDIEALNIDETSDLATRLIDSEWCQLDKYYL